jgi:hypothetical protein
MEVSGQLHALAALSPGKRAPDTHWIGGWVGLHCTLIHDTGLLNNLRVCFFKNALTVLRGTLAYPNGLLDLRIETFGRTSWPGDQPNATQGLLQIYIINYFHSPIRPHGVVLK